MLCCWPRHLIVTYFRWNLISRKWNRHVAREFNFCENCQNTERGLKIPVKVVIQMDVTTRNKAIINNRNHEEKVEMDWPRPSSGLRRKSTHCSDLDTDGKRRRGQPRATWQRAVKRERTKLGWNSRIAAEHRARDRSRWKEDVAALCATWHEEDSNKQLPLLSQCFSRFNLFLSKPALLYVSS